MEHWILVDNKLKEVDLMTWAKWFKDKTNPGRITAHTDIGEVSVSTVFIGIDHNFGEGEPLLWETMIFGSDKKEIENYQERYATLKEAEKGHKKAIEFIKEIIK